MSAETLVDRQIEQFRADVTRETDGGAVDWSSFNKWFLGDMARELMRRLDAAPDAIAGQLLDKGEDANLRARVLDLAAKWAALAKGADRSDKYAIVYRVCAGELRSLALGLRGTVGRPWVDEELEQHRDAQQGRLAEMLGPEAFADLQGRPVTRTITGAETEGAPILGPFPTDTPGRYEFVIGLDPGGGGGDRTGVVKVDLDSGTVSEPEGSS